MKNVSALTDKELIEHTDELVGRERRITIAILRHLAEIDRRRLYAPLGYSSLFDYCRRRLKYSESGANRRIRAARCARRFPSAYARLQSREVSVATLSMIGPLLTEENNGALLDRIAGKPQSEVEAIVAHHRVGKPVRDRIKPLAVPKAAVKPQPDPLFESPRMNWETSVARTSGGEMAPTKSGCDAVPGRAQTKRPVSDRHSGGKKSTAAAVREIERHYKFEFGADEGFMKKFQEVKTLMSSKFPAAAGLEDIFEVLMDEYIERHSPGRRAERREKRRARRVAREGGEVAQRSLNVEPGAGGFAGHRVAGAQNGVPRAETAGSKKPAKTRRIPRPLRDEVHRRDGGRCAFVGRDGGRCNSTHDLEIDHRMPRARGGEDTPENLRLLCAAHNRHEAERQLGRGFMERYYRRE